MEESMKDYEKELEASFRKIEEGDILKGTVIGIGDDEVTLDLKYYAQGIIKNENLSNDPGFEAEKELHYGQELTAQVVRLDDGHGNIELSMKDADNEISWEKLKEMKENKENIEVTIREAVKGGLVAFLLGIRGFIPASRVSLDYVEDLNTWVGKTITVRVIEFDQKKDKLILSAREILREARAEERANKIASYMPGDIIEGKVESIMPYGAFVALGDGISGLVHVSQIAQRRIENPGEVLKEGQKVTAKIINVKDGKISLSMKALEESAEASEKKEERRDLEKFGSSKEKASTSLGDLLSGIKLK